MSDQIPASDQTTDSFINFTQTGENNQLETTTTDPELNCQSDNNGQDKDDDVNNNDKKAKDLKATSSLQENFANLNIKNISNELPLDEGPNCGTGPPGLSAPSSSSISYHHSKSSSNDKTSISDLVNVDMVKSYQSSSAFELTSMNSSYNENAGAQTGPAGIKSGVQYSHPQHQNQGHSHPGQTQSQNNTNMNQNINIKDDNKSQSQQQQENNITASGIPLSNTLNASGSISYLPGTASLVEEVDKKQLVMLRDGRMLIGVLRSVDQFANLVLQNTSERVLVNGEFCDIQRGIYLIRGENVALMGDIDQEKEDEIQDQRNAYLTKMNEDYIKKKCGEKERKEQEERKEKSRMLRERGLIMYKEYLGDQYVN